MYIVCVCIYKYAHINIYIYGFIYLYIQVCLYYKCAVHVNLQHFQGGEYLCVINNHDYFF